MNFMLKADKKIVVPILFVLAYTGCVLMASSCLKSMKVVVISKNEYVNFQVNYQLILLAVTLLSLVGSYFLNKENFLQYFSFGELSSPAKEMKLFGIKENDSWINTGLSLSVVVSLATGIFMYFQLQKHTIDWSLLNQGIFWIILFSLTNSFGEEMIFRLGIVSPLKGLISPMSIFTISAILFGLPHYAGMPSGVIGVIMAGVLGLVLAKSMYETNGFFWAWVIHFLQDVIIIGSIYLISFKSV